MKKDLEQEQKPKQFTCKGKDSKGKDCNKSYNKQASMFNHNRINHQGNKDLIVNNTPRKSGRPIENKKIKNNHTNLKDCKNTTNLNATEAELMSTASSYKEELKPMTLKDFQRFVFTDMFKQIFQQATQITIEDDHINQQSMQNHARSKKQQQQEQKKQQKKFQKLKEKYEKDHVYPLDKIGSIFQNITTMISSMSNSINKNMIMHNQQNYQNSINKDIQMYNQQNYYEMRDKEKISNIQVSDNEVDENQFIYTDNFTEKSYYDDVDQHNPFSNINQLNFHNHDVSVSCFNLIGKHQFEFSSN